MRDKGLEKNTEQLHMLFALPNRMLARQRLLMRDGEVGS
jgi:hypothetical protein